MEFLWLFMIRLWVLRRSWVKGHFHFVILTVHMLAWFIIVGVDLNHLAEVLFVRFLHCKVTLPHPFHNAFTGKKKSLGTAHSGRAGIYSPSRGMCISIHYLDFFCKGDLSFSLIKVFFLLLLLLLVWTNGYICYSLFPALVTGAFSVDSYVLLTSALM